MIGRLGAVVRLQNDGLHAEGIRYQREIVASSLGSKIPSRSSMQQRKVAVEDTGPANTGVGGAASTIMETALTYEQANNNPRGCVRLDGW